MTISWRIAVPAIAIVIGCAAALLWQEHTKRANEQKLASDLSACRAGAVAGDPVSQFRLGSMYYYGQGVQQDYDQAARWYRLAAEQGNPKAEYGLGYMYYLGQGVPQDYAKAVEWYQRAGDQGNVQAEIDLAFMYSHGQGLQKDYTRAVDWYQRAADQGDSAGQDSIGFMYLHGQGVQQNYPKAVMWFRKAAEQGNAKGQYDLGFMLYHGFGIAEDRTEAKRWFRKAASQGNVDALRTLDIRKKGLSQWSKITLSVIALGSLLFLIDSMLPSRNLREWRQLATMLLGIFGMAFVGIDLYSASRTEYSIYANALYWGRWTLAGVSILIAVLWLRGRNEASRNGPRSNRPS